MSEPVDVVIIGGGVSGLACAKALHAAGRSFVLYEAREALGGRVMTDRHEGFLLDRGFQVLLTAYPEARQLLDYDRLHLRRFYPGALVRFSGRWHRMADSFRHPWDGLCSLFNPIGTLADKLRVGRLRLLRTKLSTRPANESTLTALQLEGFSESMIQRFFRPFLGGVYLESDLQTTAAKFASVFRYFSYGDTAVPALGMGAIPNQLACTLPPDRLRTGARVRGLMDSDVQLDDGTCVAARAVVVAAGKREAARILNEDEPPKTAFSGVTCLYFDAPVAPLGNRFWS